MRARDVRARAAASQYMRARMIYEGQEQIYAGQGLRDVRGQRCEGQGRSLPICEGQPAWPSHFVRAKETMHSSLSLDLWPFLVLQYCLLLIWEKTVDLGLNFMGF